MFPKNLIRDLIVSVAVVAFLVGMALPPLLSAGWGFIKPAIHEATASEAK